MSKIGDIVNIGGVSYEACPEQEEYSCDGCAAHPPGPCDYMPSCDGVVWAKVTTAPATAPMPIAPPAPWPQRKTTIKRVYIFDCDGVLADSIARYRTIIDDKGERIDLDHWRANEHRAMEDKLGPLAEFYQSCLQDPATYTIIATARVMNDPDWQWVREVLGEPDYFISRKAGDEQSGKTLKINGLARFFNLVNFRNAEFCFWEDNISYLKAVCDRFNIRGVYVPSKQGH